MFEHYAQVFSQLNGHLILLAGILFTLGILLADSVLDRNIGWLISYPVWVYKKIEKLMERLSNVLLTFLFIFFFNAVNLFLGFVSGFLVILPILLAIWTGLNVGIIARKMMIEQNQTGGLWLIFLNPVAVFELPAGWISFSIGLEMGIKFLSVMNYTVVESLFLERLSLFIYLVIPLLLVAALLEAAMIHYIKNKIGDKND